MNKIIILAGLIILSNSVLAQNVGINSTGAAPNVSAGLDVSFTNKGMLIPRVSLISTTDVATITTPATSLVVYNLNAAMTGGSGTGFYYWTGTVWIKLLDGLSTPSTSWNLLGNAGTNSTINFLGTTDNQPLVFRTNNLEQMRIHTDGNTSIGTTNVTTARLHVYLPTTNTTTATGIYSENEGSYTGAAYGIRNFNYNTTNGVKYGLYNYTNSAGTGARYGIYNYVLMDPATTSVGYGMRNYINSQGTATHYGLYNYISQAGTGTSYGIYNYNLLPPANTADAYGEYIYLDYTSGNRFGSYKYMNTNATYDGDVYADYNEITGTGDGVSNAVYNDINVSGVGAKTGVRNAFTNVTGTKYGIQTTIPAGTSTGTIYGMYNEVLNTSASTQYGVYNYMDGAMGAMRGCYNVLYPNVAATGSAYGVYSYVANNGTGVHYGGYFSAFGAGNYSVYATNTDAGGHAGYFYGNTQIRSAARVYSLYADYTNDVIRVGSNVGSLNGNGSALVGTTVDYVADFDNGTASGTAIGIGSIEYMVDGTSRTAINNEFDPAAHIIYDLGFSTTTEAWDDVYADDFWNVSDIREKENVKEMTYGLSEILKMRTISYTLIKDPFKDLKIGLVAQDLLPLVPEAVKTYDYKVTDESKPTEFQKVELDRMGVNYGTVVPVLVKAVQEQQAMIEELKKEIELLKAAKE